MKTRPYKWNLKRIKQSPFKNLESAKLAEKQYTQNKSIGFTQVSSLKSMGRLPRKDGYYKLGQKYKNL